MRYQQILFLFLILLLLNGCKHAESFEYREIKNLQVKHVGLTKTIVQMNLLFYNPNNFGINLKKIDCEVYFNQKYIVNYTLDTMMHISRKSSFEIPATLNFDFIDIIKRGISTVLNKEAIISIKGTAKVGKACFYKNIPLQYDIKYKLPL